MYAPEERELDAVTLFLFVGKYTPWLLSDVWYPGLCYYLVIHFAIPEDKAKLISLKNKKKEPFSFPFSGAPLADS